MRLTDILLLCPRIEALTSLTHIAGMLGRITSSAVKTSSTGFPTFISLQIDTKHKM